MLTKKQAVERDTIWVLKYYGSDAGEIMEPGSKAVSQAKRVAEFDRQWDLAEEFLRDNDLDLIVITSMVNETTS